MNRRHYPLEQPPGRDGIAQSCARGEVAEPVVGDHHAREGDKHPAHDEACVLCAGNGSLATLFLTLTRVRGAATICPVRLAIGVFAGSIAVAAACGARSELAVEPGPGGSTSGHDAALGDAPEEGALDAPADITDAEADAPPDVVVTGDCQEAGITYIYLIGNNNALLRFDPQSLTYAMIGNINCPIAEPQLMPTPYSMAVDRKGIAYIVYTDGELFRVSTATASCKATPFVMGQGGFSTEFGMGFSADVNDPGETLFIAGRDSMERAALDTTTFKITLIGTFSSPLGEAELTGTGSAQLYAFGLMVGSGMTMALHLANVDKQTAAVIADAFVTVQSGSAQILD
jgi:hypothetical protein